MTLPSLPSQGSTSWYAWAQGVHETVEGLSEGALTAVGAVIVIHGDNADTLRPDIDLPVLWFGAEAPTHADDSRDVYIPVTTA